jgi:hypothetical protein
MWRAACWYGELACIACRILTYLLNQVERTD